MMALSLKRLTSLHILIGYFILSSLLLTFIIPPFQKTDEQSHYFKTIAVASGKLWCQRNAVGQEYSELPIAHVQLPQVLLAEFTSESTNNRFPVSALLNAVALRHTSGDGVGRETESCSLPFILYLPAAAFLWLPLQLHLPPLVVFYLGRLAFLGIAWAAAALAYSIIPKQFRFVLMGCLILPMVCVQLGSYNKEVLHLAAGMVVFAGYLRLRMAFNKKLFVLFLISLTTMVLSRPFYAPMFALLPFVIPKRVIKYLTLGAVACVFIFFTFVSRILIFHQGVLTSNGVSAPLQLQYLSQNPLQFATVLTNSYVNHISAYARSLIGTFGSIHYYLDWYIYTFFGAWLFYVVLYARRLAINFSRRELVTIVGSIFAITVSAFILFYLYATPVAFQYVIDVQGRYFLAVLPFAILVLASILKRYPKGVLLTLLGISCVFLLKNTYDRYLDYSGGYHYQDAERLAATAESHTLSSVKISGETTQSLLLDPAQKLRGVTFVVVNEDQGIYDPLVVEFYSSGCSKLLQRSMMMNHIKKTTTSVDVLFRANNISQLCVKVLPFVPRANNSQPAQLARDNRTDEPRLFLMPLYAF